MRFMIASILLVIGVGLVAAQDGPPKPVKTLKIQKLPETAALYAIDSDGIVNIDWDAVETLASSKSDRTMSPVAEVILAIRDGKWKRMR